MNAQGKLASSICSKEGGVSPVTPGVTPVSPPAWAKRLANYGNIETGHAITPTMAVVDLRLPDKAFRIRDLIAAFSWKRPCPLKYEDIADAVGCSRRDAIRHVLILERLEYIDVTRRRNSCNLYSAVKPQQVVHTRGPLLPPPTMLTCPQCKKGRPMLLKVGWCRSCNWERKVLAVVKEDRPWKIDIPST